MREPEAHTHGLGEDAGGGTAVIVTVTDALPMITATSSLPKDHMDPLFDLRRWKCWN